MVINFMDLNRQCSELKAEMLDAIIDVIDSTSFVGGRVVSDFERNFAESLGVKSAISTSNGTDALFLACKSLGIKNGDEVIVPANTFIASAWAPLHCGAKVVFADCDPDTWLVDFSTIEDLITDRTKAVIGIHLYGQPFDVDTMSKKCRQLGVHLIEDCAQAHYATWAGKFVGTFGTIGCFSFYPGKNLGAYGDAGCIVTDNNEIAEKIRMLGNHGSREKYKHDIDGYNMRLDGIQAAVLSVKMKYIGSWTERRRHIAKRYDDEIHNSLIKKQYRRPEADGVSHLYVVLADDRQRFMDYMANNGINCGIHYPIPVHLQGAFLSQGYGKGSLPVTEYVAEHCVSIPMYPELTDDEVGHVVEVINSYA